MHERRFSWHQFRCREEAPALRFTIPFAYRASYLYRRHRNVQTAILRSQVEVEIEEMVPTGGPAFVLGHSRNVGRMGHAWRPFQKRYYDRQTRVWCVDGELFVEYCSIDDLGDRLLDDGDNPFGVQSMAGETALPFGLNDAHYSTSYERISAAGMLKRWDDDGGAQRAELIQRRAAALRIINGQVCVLVNEPLIVIGQVDWRWDYSISIVEGIERTPDGFDLEAEFVPKRRFRLEGLDEAHEYCRMHAFRSMSEVVIEAYPDDRLFFPQEGEHLHDDALALVNSIHDNEGWLQPHLHGPFLELRQAVLECPPRHVVPRLEPVLEDFLAIVASTRPLVTRSTGWEASEKKRFVEQVEEAVRQASTALRTWRTRPMSEQEWTEEAIAVAAWGRVHQVLSRYEMVRVGRHMRIELPRLFDARARGLHVVHGEDNSVGHFCALVTTDLSVEAVIGLNGHSLDDRPNPGLKAFLDENAKRSRDQEFLASAFV